MPVIVQGQALTALSDIINAIRNLPEPHVVALDDLEVNPNETVLCLQREAAYVDANNQCNQIRYLGTKWLHTCILIYIHTETDHLIVHVDGTQHIDLASMLSRFNYQDTVKVSLIGGLSKYSLSLWQLENIVVALLRITNQFSMNITIETQKLIERNIFREEDQAGFIYDLIFRNAAILCKQYMGQPLNTMHFKERKSSDFHTRSVPLTNELIIMLKALVEALEIGKLSKKIELDALDEEFREKICDEQTFRMLLDAAFSMEGFNFFNDHCKSSGLYERAQLPNFVIDIKTGYIIPVDAYMPTPEEDRRALMCIDAYQKAKYFLFYDGGKNEQFFPDVSDLFKNRCKELIPLVQNKYLDDECMRQWMRSISLVSTGTFQWNLIIRYVRRLAEIANEKRSKLTALTFLNSTRKLTSFHRQLFNEICKDNLSLLREITNRNFHTRQRIYPRHAIDALLCCATEADAIQVKTAIEAKEITAFIIKVNPQENYVCIPSIDLLNYAQKLKQMLGRKISIF